MAKDVVTFIFNFEDKMDDFRHTINLLLTELNSIQMETMSHLDKECIQTLLEFVENTKTFLYDWDSSNISRKAKKNTQSMVSRIRSKLFKDYNNIGIQDNLDVKYIEDKSREIMKTISIILKEASMFQITKETIHKRKLLTIFKQIASMEIMIITSPQIISWSETDIRKRFANILYNASELQGYEAGLLLA